MEQDCGKCFIQPFVYQWIHPEFASCPCSCLEFRFMFLFWYAKMLSRWNHVLQLSIYRCIHIYGRPVCVCARVLCLFIYYNYSKSICANKTSWVESYINLRVWFSITCMFPLFLHRCQGVKPVKHNSNATTFRWVNSCRQGEGNAVECGCKEERALPSFFHPKVTTQHMYICITGNQSVWNGIFEMVFFKH